MTFRTSFRASALFLFALPVLTAAPILRVHLPTVSNDNPDALLLEDGRPLPIWIQQGTNGPTGIFFEVWNAGDGQVNPQISGGFSPWLQPVVTGTQFCTFDAGRVCSFVRVFFEAAGLPRGTFQGEITVSDANAVDSPQHVPVTIHVDGTVPDNVELYIAAAEGNSAAVEFQTPAGPAPVVSVAPDGQFLSVSSSGQGSFRFLHNHRVAATFSSGMGVGDLAGSLSVSGSSFGPDNRAGPVTVHVTNSPIADSSSDSVILRTGLGIDPPPGAVVLSNRGLGSLSVSGVDVSTSSGEEWLSTEDVGNNIFLVRAAVGDLGAGLYGGELIFNSNAANAPVRIPVALEIGDSSAPQALFSGLVNGASFDPLQGIAPGAIVSLFGISLANAVDLPEPDDIPLPRELEGARVRVNGIDAPFFFVSPRQLNFQVPVELSPGGALIEVIRDGVQGNSVSATVFERSPGIFRIGIENYGAIVNASQGNFPLPPDIGAQLGLTTTPARPGDILVIFATGLGAVDNPVATGEATPDSPFARTIERPKVRYSTSPFGLSERAQFSGLSPRFVGLYQVNAPIPETMGNNPRTPVIIEFSDGTRSNTVHIAVER